MVLDILNESVKSVPPWWGITHATCTPEYKLIQHDMTQKYGSQLSTTCFWTHWQLGWWMPWAKLQSSGFINNLNWRPCRGCASINATSTVSQLRARVLFLMPMLKHVWVSQLFIANLEPLKGGFVDSVLVITSFASISDRIKSGATTSSATPSARKKPIQQFLHLNLHLWSTSFLLRKLVEAAQVAS